MGKVLAIANQKGGVAKTTSTGTLAAGLSDRGYTVLVVDLDPQGNLSECLGANNIDAPTILDVMKGSITAADAVQHAHKCDIIPANIMLAGAEQVFTQVGKEQRLKEMLNCIVEDYDYILFDTPPALGLLTINAFTAADEILITTTPGIFAAKGISQLHDTIENVRKYCNPHLKINGILITRYNAQSNINKTLRDVTEQFASYINAPVYKTPIRNSVAIEEAHVQKTDVFSTRQTSGVAADYQQFVSEFLEGEAESK